MMSPTSTSRPSDGTSLESRLLDRIRAETKARHKERCRINEANTPYRLRLNSNTGEWELRIDSPDEGPGPYLDGPKTIYGGETDE